MTDSPLGPRTFGVDLTSDGDATIVSGRMINGVWHMDHHDRDHLDFGKIRQHVDELAAKHPVPDWQRQAYMHHLTLDWPTHVQKVIALWARRASTLEEISWLRFLAAHPWLLHQIARTPAWRTFAEAHHG